MRILYQRPAATASLIFHLFFLRNFNALEEHLFEELSSILDLSTRWGFASIRDMAIRRIEPPTPHQRLILGRKHGVDEWIPLALRELCERPQPLTPDEARLMDFEDVVLVGSVREKVRNQALTVDSAGLRDCIEALRRGEPWTMPRVGASTPPEAPKPQSPSSIPLFESTVPNTVFGTASNSATVTTGSVFGRIAGSGAFGGTGETGGIGGSGTFRGSGAFGTFGVPKTR